MKDMQNIRVPALVATLGRLLVERQKLVIELDRHPHAQRSAELNRRLADVIAAHEAALAQLESVITPAEQFPMPRTLELRIAALPTLGLTVGE